MMILAPRKMIVARAVETNHESDNDDDVNSSSGSEDDGSKIE